MNLEELKEKAKNIRIDFSNLTEHEQIELFLNLFEFADKKLPNDKTLFIYVEKTYK